MEKKYEGTCPECGKDVYSNQLFTEERGEVYHLSCYNYKKKKENEKKDKKGWW